MSHSRNQLNRRGSVYLAVLGTAMIASVLAFSALALQRVQNRMLGASSDIQQAQLNAEAAVQMGMHTINNNATWRTSHPHGNWFTDRGLGEGSASLSVVDPLDENLSDSSTEPFVMTGVGSAGNAVQRVTRTFDAYPQALDCLRSAVAAGGDIVLNGCTLRVSRTGLITANSISASGSNVFGRVQALSVGGGTYRDATSQVAASDRPKMPDWNTVFDYYKDNGTEISINAVPSSMGSFTRNGNFNSNDNHWTGTPTGAPSSTLEWVNLLGNGALRVYNRSASTAGAAQAIDAFIKPGQPITINASVNHVGAQNFRIRLVTKGTASSENTSSTSDILRIGTGVLFAQLGPVTLTAPSWSGELEYAYVIISGGSGNSSQFYLDNVTISDASTGKFIFREVLGPGINSISNSVNPQGLYWINCMNNRIVIERSRIKGTLLLINPGAGSMIGAGSINWSPNTPGFPILLVDADTPGNADFTIAATNRMLSEVEDRTDQKSTNYNPAGAPHESLGTDNELNDIYPSELNGLILVRDDLVFQNNGLVRGSIIVGDQVTATSGSLEVDYRPDALYSPPPGLQDAPKHVPRPLSVRKVVGP